MNVGAWDKHHADLVTPRLYGDGTTYQLVAELAAGLGTVADWGCGGGGLAAFIEPGQEYIGIDGSISPFASVHADLRKYHEPSDVVVLRHVLEHNDDWAVVLDNAYAAALKRLIVVLFTPLVEETFVMFREPDYGHVPVIAFALADVLARFTESMVADLHVDTFVSSATAFAVETVVSVDR